MNVTHLYSDAVDAIDAMLADVGYELIGKASILSRPGYEATLRSLIRAIAREVSTPDTQAIAAAARRLDARWTQMSEADRERIVSDAAREILLVPKIIVPKVQDVMRRQLGPAIVDTKRATARRDRITIQPVLSAFDEKVVEHAATSQAHYITDQYGWRARQFEQRARDIVSKGLEEGLGRDDIGGRLHEQLTGPMMRTARSYWNTVAAIHMTRARSWGQLATFTEAGIDRYVWESVLDEVTSEVCRFMHGKVFEVESAVDRYKQVEASPYPTDVEDLQPWVKQGVTADGQQYLFTETRGQTHMLAQVTKPGYGKQDRVGKYARAASSSRLQSLGIDSPPAHPNCRSTLVAE